MQFTRRYLHLVLVLSAYAFLILAARWAFFAELWSIMESEQDIDGTHEHAVGRKYELPMRYQRHVSETEPSNKGDIQNVGLDSTMNGDKDLNQRQISKIVKKNLMLNKIFMNFLHP
ncbi:hypothetical protein ACF0H5_010482 [Mactra antiquata]